MGGLGDERWYRRALGFVPEAHLLDERGASA
jgi:hypothetical protein